MQYCLVKDNVIGRPQALPRNWDNISNFYLLAPEIVATYGWFPCHTSEKPAYDDRTQKLTEALTLGDAEVFQTWHVVDLTPEEQLQYLRGKREIFKQFLDNYLNEQVAPKDYDSILSATSWLNSSVPEWKADSAAAIAFREQCFLKAYEIENAVLAGTRPIPTESEFQAEMPVLWNPPAPPDNGNLPSNGTI
jgi:hypothetical protein